MKKLLAVLLPVTIAIGCIGGVTQNRVYAKEIKEESVTFQLEADQVAEGLTKEDLDQIAKDRGYMSIKINKDGSASITVSAKKGKELAQEMIDDFKDIFQRILDNENNAFTNINYDGNSFEYFRIKTMNQEVTSQEQTAIESLTKYVEQVHDLRGISNYTFKVIFVNSETENVINEFSKTINTTISEYTE